MKFSISNIAWPKAWDQEVYVHLREKGFSAIEIAPLRSIDTGYDATQAEIEIWLNEYHQVFNEVSSMQSLLFKMEGSIFSSEAKMEDVLTVLKKGILFASSMGVKNLVFGSPTLRDVNSEEEYERAIRFFSQLADDSEELGISLALEPNPVIYNTNFINTTKDALAFVQALKHPNLGINLDLGTVIENKELIHDMINQTSIAYIKHVHISEPYLQPIDFQRSDFHLDVIQHLKMLNYDRFVSIEMKPGLTKDELFEVVDYIYKIAIEAGVLHEK